MIKHLVFIRYAADVSAQTKTAIMNDLAALRTEIDGILDFGHAENISPEDPVVHGLRDMFWFDFRDVATRDAYLDNPTHKEIGARIGEAADGGADGIFVCDIQLP